MPSLFGLVLLCFACGAMAALATRRRGSVIAATAAALGGGLGGVWATAAFGWPIEPIWALLAGSAAAAMVVAGLGALVTRRR